MTPQELKSSILKMAFQGMLVEQRSEEGTAEELYRQIQEQKKRLIKDKKIKKDKLLPEITEDEKPLNVPDRWMWVRLQNISASALGKTLDKAKNTGYMHPYLCSINVYWDGINLAKVKQAKFEDNELSKYALKTGDLLICEGGDVGRCAVWEIDDEMYYQNAIHRVRFYGGISPFFYKYLFELYKALGIIDAHSKGMTIKHLVQSALNQMLLPLPPLAEQKRIVAKIEELLPYIDRYEQAWSKLKDFNKRFPVDMQKSILQMAIQGKLVEQWPEEGTGEELYQQIQAEKQQLIKAKAIKKDKPLPQITDDEKPFDIPDSWKWVRLQEIGELNRGRSQHRPRNDPHLYTNGTVPMIQTGDVARANKYITDWSVMYNDIGVAQSRIWKAGTVCLTIAANIGDVAILTFDACFPDSVVGFNAYMPIVSNEYFLYGLMWYKNMLDAMSRSTAQKNININILSQIAFPLPPLAEQKRIVEKLEEILPLCERLKKLNACLK